MALTIVKSDEATLGQKAIAGGYVALEGAAHAALVVGSIACASNPLACVGGAQTALGIGGTATGAAEAACADGDCTNEASSFTVTGRTVIDFVSNQINKVSHIMQPKHAWDRLTTLTGDISKDYQAVQPYVQQAIDKGVSSQIATTPQGYPVFQYNFTINGQVVIVNAITMTNNVIQITDAWVKTE